MMRVYVGNILAVLTIAWVSQAIASNYSLKDLEILEEQKNYEEFLLHARDVRPVERTKQWTEMVQTMAVGYLDFHTKRQNYIRPIFKYLQTISKWPSLREDEFFLMKREKFVLKYLNICFYEQRPYCTKEVTDFWNTHNKDPESGFKLADLLKKYKPSYDIWSYVQASTANKFSEFYCHRPLIQKELLRKLVSEYSNRPATLKTTGLLKKYAHSECWKKFNPYLKERMYEESGQKQLVIFEILKAQKMLSQIEEDTFLTFYYLQGPKIGKTFNLAWRTLQRLSESFEQRNEVLTRLQKMDPLPGKIFSEANVTRRATLLGHFKLNFPEYISSYSKTCLNYLEGKIRFPNGNPTLDCHSLMKGKFIEQSVKIRYSGTRKFSN